MTNIEWTDVVWNPVTGCDKVSEGCRNCYAETIAHRFWGERPFTEVRCHPERLDAPLHWKKPRRVFVNSMSDLFHKDVSDEFIDKVLAMMALTPQHRYQVLTKRPERMLSFLRDSGYRAEMTGIEAEFTSGLDRFEEAERQRWPFPLPNVWLGVSIEDQETADERIPILLQTPAAVRWVSAEPLLGPVDFTEWLYSCDGDCDRPTHPPLPTLDWVVGGGESGPLARPCQLGWIRAIVQQCQTAGIPVFVKQFGSHPYADVPELETWSVTKMDENGGLHFASRKGGDPSEWPVDLRIRKWPRVEVEQ